MTLTLQSTIDKEEGRDCFNCFSFYVTVSSFLTCFPFISLSIPHYRPRLQLQGWGMMGKGRGEKKELHLISSRVA